MMAAVNGHWGVVDGLLRKGADPHAKDEVSCFWRSMTVLT
jgi:ankyrin repeat protein